MTSWRDDLKAAVTRPFGAAMASRAASTGSRVAPWAHADAPELVGLEAWGRELATRDLAAGIGALVRAAQFGFPQIMSAAGSELDNMGFRASEPSMDGAPVETQIAVAAAWLDSPDEATRAAVEAAFDPTRQLQVWDDDLLPADDNAYQWYLEMGQCCCAAIIVQGSAEGDTYYEWDPPTSVGRGLVIAARGLRMPGTSLAAILDRLGDALVA